MFFSPVSLFYVYAWFARMYLCARYVCLVPVPGQKRAPEPLELGFQAVVNHHVCAGD